MCRSRVFLVSLVKIILGKSVSLLCRLVLLDTKRLWHLLCTWLQVRRLGIYVTGLQYFSSVDILIIASYYIYETNGISVERLWYISFCVGAGSSIISQLIPTPFLWQRWYPLFNSLCNWPGQALSILKIPVQIEYKFESS